MPGFTLIEVLVSLLILSLMLLSVDAMQLTTLREAKSAYYAAIATQQLNYLQAIPSASREDQLAEWNAHNKQVLPNGYGTLDGNKISIFWGDQAHKFCGKNKIGRSGCLSVAL